MTTALTCALNHCIRKVITLQSTVLLNWERRRDVVRTCGDPELSAESQNSVAAFMRAELLNTQPVHEKLMLFFSNHYHQEDNILDEQIINANPLRESSEEKS